MRLIKGAREHHGDIHGPGYALPGHQDASGHQITYRLPLPHRQACYFVFGFRGVGSHFLLELRAQQGLVALYQIKDGIPLYLNHVLVRLAADAIVDVVQDADFLSISSSGYALLNVLHEGNAEGDWGFSVPRGHTLSLPRVEIVHQQVSPLEWIVLGDGFSNNRWPNRHFVSWPELLFGPEVSYVNACVAAANSRRVIQVAQRLVPRMRNTQVIVAMGTDDLIEGGVAESFLRNLDDLVTLLHNAGVRYVWIINLPPVRSQMALIPELNEILRRRLCNPNIALVDTHSLLMQDHSTCMAQGEYPNASGQWLIAQHLAPLLGGLNPQRPPIITPRDGLLSKAAMRLSGLFARFGSRGPRLSL
jgi:hypothetical protein